ncbi:MAG: hypothetical protein CMJ49_01435 [Planctomycetaceae bacterium]|nr:hypothetical protein [Planctomycetaceae bacterium]
MHQAAQRAVQHAALGLALTIVLLCVRPARAISLKSHTAFGLTDDRARITSDPVVLTQRHLPTILVRIENDARANAPYVGNGLPAVDQIQPSVTSNE